MPSLHFEIKRVTPTAIAFNPPKGSDALHEALRTDYPHLDTLQKRMQQAVLDFLLAESVVHQQLAEQATQQYLSTPPSSHNTPPSYLTSPESSFMAYTPPSENVSPKQGSTNSTAQQEMMDVWSLPTATQTKQHKRRCMTSSEKEVYRLKRLQGACADCKRRRRKCHHDQSSSRPDQPARVSPTLSLASEKSGRLSSQPTNTAMRLTSKCVMPALASPSLALETEAFAVTDFSAFDLPDWQMPEQAPETIDPFAWGMPADQDWTLYSGVASPSSQFADDSVPAAQSFSRLYSSPGNQLSYPTTASSRSLHTSESPTKLDLSDHAFYEDWFIDTGMNGIRPNANNAGMNDTRAIANDASMDGTRPNAKNADIDGLSPNANDAIHRTHTNPRPDHIRSTHPKRSGQDELHRLEAFADGMFRLHHLTDQRSRPSHVDLQPENILMLSQRSASSSTSADCSYGPLDDLKQRSTLHHTSDSAVARSTLPSDACTLLLGRHSSQDKSHAYCTLSYTWATDKMETQGGVSGRSASGTNGTRDLHAQRSLQALDHPNDRTPPPSEILKQPRSAGDSIALAELVWQDQEISDSSRLLQDGFPSDTLQRSSPSDKHSATQRENIDTRNMTTLMGTSSWAWAAPIAGPHRDLSCSWIVLTLSTILGCYMLRSCSAESIFAMAADRILYSLLAFFAWGLKAGLADGSHLAMSVTRKG